MGIPGIHCPVSMDKRDRKRRRDIESGVDLAQPSTIKPSGISMTYYFGHGEIEEWDGFEAQRPVLWSHG
jgi:hypothetical protein